MATRSAELRVGTLNAHCGRDPRGSTYSLAAVLDVVAADVVLVQENWRPDGGESVAAGAAKELAYSYVAELDVLGGTSLHDLGVVKDLVADEPGAWGLAVLSRVPLVVREPVWLGVAPGDVGRRAAQVVDVIVDGRAAVRLANTHFTHRLVHGPRQLRRLVSALRGGRPPTMIGGDLNMCRPLVYAAWPYQPLVRGRTWPARRPVAQLDHLLGGTRMHVLDRAVVAVVGSDHLPARVTIELEV